MNRNQLTFYAIVEKMKPSSIKPQTQRFAEEPNTKFQSYFGPPFFSCTGEMRI